MAEFGSTKAIRVDNGPKYISQELDLWADMKGVTLDFSRSGKPTDNTFIESFNGEFRADAHWFTSIEEMRQICEDWHNELRPHSALGNSE